LSCIERHATEADHPRPRPGARLQPRRALLVARLREIAETGGLSPLGTHGDFEAMIKARHPRKAAFLARVTELPVR